MASDNFSTDRLPEVLPPTPSVPRARQKSPDRDTNGGARRRSRHKEEEPDDLGGELPEAPGHQLDHLV